MNYSQFLIILKQLFPPENFAHTDATSLTLEAVGNSEIPAWSVSLEKEDHPLAYACVKSVKDFTIGQSTVTELLQALSLPYTTCKVSLSASRGSDNVSFSISGGDFTIPYHNQIFKPLL